MSKTFRPEKPAKGPVKPTGKPAGKGPVRGAKTADGRTPARKGPRPDFKAERRPDRDGKHARTVRRDTMDKASSAVQGDGWVCGQHAVRMALTAGRRDVMEVLLALNSHEVKVFQDEFPLARVQNVARSELDRLFPDSVHQGIAARVGSLPQPTLPDILKTNPTRLVALDQVTDPHNVGAILRSCAAFGVDAVLLPERRTAGITPVVAKTAAGALETVPVAVIGNLTNSLTVLQEKGFTVLGLAGEGEVEINHEFTWPDKVVLVLGSEGEGLRLLTRKTCDFLVRIPMTQAVESLNVSVAAGVVLASMFNSGQKTVDVRE